MTSLQQHVARRPAEAVGHLPRALDAVGLLQRRLHARVEVQAERRERRADARGGLAHLGERPLDGDRVGLAEQVAVQRGELRVRRLRRDRVAPGGGRHHLGDVGEM